jgi:hypothetical protein
MDAVISGGCKITLHLKMYRTTSGHFYGEERLHIFSVKRTQRTTCCLVLSCQVKWITGRETEDTQNGCNTASCGEGGNEVLVHYSRQDISVRSVGH